MKASAFFHTKLGLDVLSQGKQPSFGDTLQELTRPIVDQSPSADGHLSMGIGVKFWLPDALPGVNQLQIREEIQNSLAHAIYPSAKRSNHVSPLLHKLHWLPVSCIEFKIATLTFKVLKFQQPAYMFDLSAPYIPPRSLRSSNKNLLIVPDIRSEMGRRSFSFAAPTIWNSLPQHIRSSDSLSVFRGLLKTFFYQKSLPP